MPGNVDPVGSTTFEFTQTHTIFGGVVNLLRRLSSFVVSSAFGFELFGSPENHPLVSMNSPRPIDISSSNSDSDFREIDNYVDESTSSATASSSMNFRVLPSWASSDNSNAPGHNGRSSKGPSSSSSSSKRRSFNGKTSSRPPKRMNVAGSAGINFSNQPMKRALPASIQSSTSRLPTVENVGAKSDMPETYGKSFPSVAWSNSSNVNNSMKEKFVEGRVNNNPSSNEKRGNRLLPPTLMPGRYSSTNPFIGLNDSLHPAGDGEERHADVDETFVFQAAVQDLHQPKVQADLPHGILSVALLRHQKIALAWMLSKESSGLCLGGILADDQGLGKTVSMIALIQMQKLIEAKSKAKKVSSSRTEALNLDDDDEDGSGVVALDDDSNQVEESEDFTILPRARNTIKGFRSRRPKTGTLVVCPASILRQWDRELNEKVTDKAKLSVLIYHGGNRTKRPAALAKYDVVLTTYTIVANEVPKQPVVEEDDEEQKDGDQSSEFPMEKKRKKPSAANKKLKKGKKENDSDGGPLARVKWSRVILDESQTIKNHRTQVARACCSLRAKRRWCLSGTPIQNSVDELFSYFRFLRYDPYDKYKVFTASIKSLISRDSTTGYKKLQVVLRNIMLRRTKGTLLDGEPIINLPQKKTDLMKVDFSSEERTFYNKLEADSRKQFKAYASAGTLNQNYANILLMLLRLRQACDHPLLVKGSSRNAAVGKVPSEVAKNLPREMLFSLLKQLETSKALCLVCNDPPENAVVTMCGHVFCYQCVSDNLTGEDHTCPAPDCKEQLGADVVYSRPTLQKCISHDADADADADADSPVSPISCEPGETSMVLQSAYISSKIAAALDIITSHCLSKLEVSKPTDKFRYHDGASSSGGVHCRDADKAIVFSQWTSMLDLVEMSLKNFCINYQRLDGTMSIAARDKAVKEFNTDPQVDVMLMSLKAGNLGLNMVAACRVILLDLWWNPTTEDQAVDRAHRIGQTRPVTVSRLTIKDTVEDRILALQEDKRKIVASAFGEDQSGGLATRLTVEDLRFLFEGRR